jgi:hypothetical protein
LEFRSNLAVAIMILFRFVFRLNPFSFRSSAAAFPLSLKAAEKLIHQ